MNKQKSAQWHTTPNHSCFKVMTPQVWAGHLLPVLIWQFKMLGHSMLTSLKDVCLFLWHPDGLPWPWPSIERRHHWIWNVCNSSIGCQSLMWIGWLYPVRLVQTEQRTECFSENVAGLFASTSWKLSGCMNCETRVFIFLSKCKGTGTGTLTVAAVA